MGWFSRTLGIAALAAAPLPAQEIPKDTILTDTLAAEDTIRVPRINGDTIHIPVITENEHTYVKPYLLARYIQPHDLNKDSLQTQEIDAINWYCGTILTHDGLYTVEITRRPASRLTRAFGTIRGASGKVAEGIRDFAPILKENLHDKFILVSDFNEMAAYEGRARDYIDLRRNLTLEEFAISTVAPDTYCTERKHE